MTPGLCIPAPDDILDPTGLNTIHKFFRVLALGAALLIAGRDRVLAECPCQVNAAAAATESMTGKITELNRAGKTMAIVANGSTYHFRFDHDVQAKVGEVVEVTYGNFSGGLPRIVKIDSPKSKVY